MVARTCKFCQSAFETRKGAQFYCDPCRSRCAVDGCGLPMQSNGYCTLHYDRLKTRGEAGTAGRERNWQTGACDVDGCERGATKRGFCDLHYMRARHGDVGPSGLKVKPRGVPCAVGGCDRLADAAGLCNMHYCRQLAHGDPGEAAPRIAAKGSGHTTRKGYRIIIRNGERILEHRAVLEEKLGRRLRPNEQAHHLDGDRTNNHPSNIEHWVIHQPSGQRVTDRVASAIALLRDYPEVAKSFGVRIINLESQEATDLLKDEMSSHEVFVGLGFGV